MTLLQTLNKSIKKALAAGYNPMPGYKVKTFKATVNKSGFGHIAWLLEHERGDEIVLSQVTFSINDLLFDHGFLKAVYGMEVLEPVEHLKTPVYKYHAEQLSYLESNKGRINYVGSTL